MQKWKQLDVKLVLFLRILLETKKNVWYWVFLWWDQLCLGPYFQNPYKCGGNVCRSPFSCHNTTRIYKTHFKSFYEKMPDFTRQDGHSKVRAATLIKWHQGHVATCSGGWNKATPFTVTKDVASQLLTEQLWLISALLKGTSFMTGIWTHIQLLIRPELGSGGVPSVRRFVLIHCMQSRKHHSFINIRAIVIVCTLPQE